MDTTLNYLYVKILQIGQLHIPSETIPAKKRKIVSKFILIALPLLTPCKSCIKKMEVNAENYGYEDLAFC